MVAADAGNDPPKKRGRRCGWNKDCERRAIKRKAKAALVRVEARHAASAAGPPLATTEAHGGVVATSKGASEPASEARLQAQAPGKQGGGTHGTPPRPRRAVVTGAEDLRVSETAAAGHHPTYEAPQGQPTTPEQTPRPVSAAAVEADPPAPIFESAAERRRWWRMRLKEVALSFPEELQDGQMIAELDDDDDEEDDGFADDPAGGAVRPAARS